MIHLLGAIPARHVDWHQDGFFALEPLRIQVAELPAHVMRGLFTTKPVDFLLVFYSDDNPLPGHFQLSLAVARQGETLDFDFHKVETRRVDWTGQDALFELKIDFGEGVDIVYSGPGVYEFKFLIDGQPAGQVAIPIISLQ